MFEGLFQPMHMLVILIIALVVFGPGKLPELGSAIGKSIREFKKAIAENDKNVIEVKKEESPQNSTENKA